MSEEDFPPSKIKAIQQIQQAKTTTQQAPTPKAPSSAESPFSEDVIVGPYEEVKPIAQQAALRTAFDLPKEATDIKVTRTPEGMQVEYKQPQQLKQPTLAETWIGAWKPQEMPEFILSELAFRRHWDPAWKAKGEARQKEFESKFSTEERQMISKLRTQELTIAASAAIIGYAAFDIGRSLYHMWKWGGARGPVETTLSPELEEQPFTYTQISGAKGARAAETMTYKPHMPKPEEFKVAWSRGTSTTPMSVTLGKVIRSKEALSTLPELLFWPSQMQSVKVPLGLYEPRFLSEFVFTGISLGQLSQVSQAVAVKQTQVAKRSVTQPLRLFEKKESLVGRIQRTFPIQRTMQIQGINQMLMLEQEASQIQGLKQRQMLAVAQRQVQRQKTVSKEAYFPRTSEPSMFKREFRFGKGAWFFKRHPLPTPSQVLGGFGLPSRKRRKHKK